jgi:hypothetical protein
MKNLLNNISQDEKNRILEMHSGKKNVISEELTGDDYQLLLNLKNKFPKFKEDSIMKQAGIRNLMIGNDNNGAFVQMKDLYTVHFGVTKNGKTMLDKTMKITSNKSDGAAIYDSIVSEFNKLGIK